MRHFMSLKRHEIFTSLTGGEVVWVAVNLNFKESQN